MAFKLIRHKCSRQNDKLQETDRAQRSTTQHSLHNNKQIREFHTRAINV